MSSISAQPSTVLDFQANLSPVATIAATPVTLFTYTPPTRFCLGNGQGILIQALWQHAGANTINYAINANALGTTTSTNVQSVEQIWAAQSTGANTINDRLTIGNAGVLATPRATLVQSGNVGLATPTFTLTATAGAGTDLVTPLFWLVTLLK